MGVPVNRRLKTTENLNTQVKTSENLTFTSQTKSPPTIFTCKLLRQNGQVIPYAYTLFKIAKYSMDVFAYLYKRLSHIFCGK